MDHDGQGLFFIVGTGRCGTTLLQAMLMSHPRLHIPPETRFFTSYDPALAFSDPLIDDDQARRYVAACTADPYWKELGIDPAAFQKAVDAGVRSARDLFLWVMGELSRSSAKPRLGEKTPRHEKPMARILELFPDARFIHIHRDPRDVVASLRTQYWASSFSILRSAVGVRKTLQRLARWEQRLPASQFLRLRYETLVAQPESELRRVCAFLGEEFDPAMLAYHQRPDSGFLPSEKGWKDLTKKPIDPSRQARYRKDLTPREIWTIERILGPLLLAHGYQRDNAAAPGPGRRAAWLLQDAREWLAWRGERYARSVRKRLSPASASHEPSP